MDDLCESSDDSSMEDEIIEIPNGSLQKVMTDFQHKLQAQYNNNNVKSFIVINENFVVESLIEWAKNANDNDLLRCPSIGLVIEE